MITKPLIRNAFKIASFVFVFFWTTLAVNAQCPALNPTPPTSPICNATGFKVSDLNAYATDNGGGIAWYTTSTGGTALSSGQLVTERTYYLDTNPASCGSRQSVDIDFTINPTGQILDKVYCSNENATIQTYIDDVLTTYIPSGGSVRIFNDLALTNQANTSDVIPNGFKTYYVVFYAGPNGTGCSSQIEVAKTAVFVSPPDPTPSNPQMFCASDNPTIGDLNTGTAFANYYWYSSIDTNGVPTSGDLALTTPLVNGSTYYIQVDNGCVSNAIPVTVNIDTPVDAGTSASLEYCNDSLPTSDFNLYELLGNPKVNTGSWSGPLVTSGGHLGTVNISTLTAENNYVFTYTVPSAGVCPDGVATVSINVYQVYSSGTVSAANPASFCVANLPSAFDLSTLIDNEDAGGQWTQGTTSSGTVITNPIDLSGYTPATYNFTYTQNVSNPCPEQSTTVQVIVLPNPNAGVAVNQTFCENDLAGNSPFDLFMALDGSQDNNSGIWRDASDVTISSSLDLTSLTVAGSPYSFNYTIDNGTCSDTEIITITIEPAPESGTADAPAEFCEGTAPASYNLFDLLTDEDQTGTWYSGLDNTGAVVSNPVDLSALTPGDYNFTFDVDAIGSCDDELVTVMITINPLPNTGTATPAVFCENDLAANSPLDLFAQLSGEDAGGTWTDDNTTGALSGSSVNLNSLTIGSFNFTYTITDVNGCTNSSTVVITVEDAPESGTVNAPIAFCEGTAPASYNLFDLLTGEDQTGTWYSGLDNTGAVVSNPVDLSALTPGDYNFTFDVDAIGSCDDELVTVMITINPLPNTGTPTPAVFCENDLAANSPLDLFAQLSGEDAGGTWTDDNTTGALTGSNVNLNSLAIGSFNFTYTITDVNGCTNSSTVVITVEDAPESGTPNAPIAFCEGTAPASYNLFDLLTGEDQTGSWYSGLDNTGAVVSNPVDLSALTPGDYNFTFDVDAIGSCDDELVTVMITINPLPNTGTATPAVFCENDLAANSPLDLFAQLSGEDAGGTWTDDNTTGALSGSSVNLNSLTIGSYNFSYTITDVNGCTNSSTVVVTVEDAPESGTPNAPIEFCIASITTGQTYNLFDLLTGEDQAGVWSDDDASGALSGNSVNLDGLASGTYNFTYDVDAIGSCDDVLVTVTIVINDTAAPTAPATQEFCDSATIANLSATGTTIQWYDNATGGTALLGTTALIDGEDYFASQTDAATGCESSVRTSVTATIYQSPKSGVAIAMADCNTNNAIDLFAGLDGTQDAGGVWTNDDGVGTLTGSTFDATGVTPGNYQFTYLVTASAPCVDASTTITVTVDGPLNAGTNNALDVCSNNGTTDLFGLIGSADTGGTWSPAMASGTGVFNPLVDASGTYTYMLSNACGTVSSEVVVTVTLAPNAGTDNTAAICVIDGPTDLFTFLGTSAQSGGTWSPALPSGTGVFDPSADAPGIYTYTVAAVSPCYPDASAQITVTANDSPQIVVLDANPSFCLVDRPTVANLAASIQPTGTVNWYTDATLSTPLLTSAALVDGEDYFATQTTASGCESSLSVQINVTINDTPTPTLMDASKEYCINDGPTINDLTLNILEYNSSSSNVVWYDASVDGNVVSDSETLVNLATYYAALIDATTGCESSVRLEVTPDLTSCGELFLPDGFSPNGDGVNDTYEVNNLDILYPKFEMQIYNRYGNLVYKGNASTPRFNGRSNQSRTTVKGDLPVGMYYYIFIFNDGENKPKQGHLYLSR
ncbi:gliding motility-associated C-terminal domain-containing protein [Mariniflexile aquimaris]|uniref:Gliding motility-associated C-terminal domain-containing protein n=1 Tax=Mariniflexile aquimaris TaxID=881009 RepID=A0ABW3BVN8_9FLAO